MKRALIVLTVLQIFASGSLCAQNTASGGRVLKTLRPDHPRLLLLKGEENALLRQIHKYPQWQAVHKLIIEECDQMLELAPVEHVKIGKRLLDKSRECLRRVFMLSYAYRTTGQQK